MVGEKKTDENLSIILFSYITTYKVAIGYTPYQSIYGLHPLMPTKYVLSTINGHLRNLEPTRMLIARIIELEKLYDNKLETKNNMGVNEWSGFLWNQENL